MVWGEFVHEDALAEVAVARQAQHVFFGARRRRDERGAAQTAGARVPIGAGELFVQVGVLGNVGGDFGFGHHREVCFPSDHRREGVGGNAREHLVGEHARATDGGIAHHRRADHRDAACIEMLLVKRIEPELARWRGDWRGAVDTSFAFALAFSFSFSFSFFSFPFAGIAVAVAGRVVVVDVDG